jgi:hypothetical protein
MDVSLVERGAGDQLPPLCVSVLRASKLTGYGVTTIWGFIRDGHLEVVRLPGIRRTLVSYASLQKLLTPATSPARHHRRGRPRKARTEKVSSGRSPT